MTSTALVRPGSELAAQFAKQRAVIVRAALLADTIARWRATAHDLVRRFGIDIERRSGSHVLSYRVVTGEVIREHFAELWEFYTAAGTREWMRTITGASAISASPHLRSAININCLEQPGQRYRWHFDAHPFTLLLYLTDNETADGGELEFYANLKQGRAENGEWESQVTSAEHLSRQRKISVPSRAGTIVLMDGTACYHSAAPILRPCLRLSVPMVYPASAIEDRPPGLDDYLYQAR